MIHNQGDSQPADPVVSAKGQARILQYWKAIELFSPQKVPRVNPNNRKEPALRVAGRTPLPWDSSNWFPAPDRDRQWRFTAYCGVYKQGRVRALLEKNFGRDRANFDQRPDGESCLFALQITADGRPLLDTFVLASCPWASGRLTNPGPADDGWLDGFEAAAKEEALSFAERFAVLENDEIGRELNSRPGVYVGRPIQPTDLENEVERIADVLHVAAALQPKQVRLVARQINENYAFETDSDDFLNSFFLRDLERLAGEAVRSNLSASLSLYLTPDDAVKREERCDVRTSLDDLWQKTSPRLVPTGRWPAPPMQSLYFSQQFAVNSALDEFQKGSPLFGVNGPPGTGKTTLLRDLIVSVVVQRAQILATLGSPELAFPGAPSHWQTAGYRRSVFPWREDLLGFGIVVGSSNNRAVENVTLEIPAKRAVAEDYLSEIDYFADFATRILKERNQKVEEQDLGEAWGLIAARLGSKKNRSKFVSKFWYADQEAPTPRSRSEKGFLEYLKSVKPKRSAWKNAVASFKDALKQEAVIRTERGAAWMEVDTRTKLAERLTATRTDFQVAKTSMVQAREQVRASDDFRTACKSRLDEAMNARGYHRKFKPGLVDALFTLGTSYREWRQRDLLLVADIEALLAKYKCIGAEHAERQQQLSAFQERIENLTADVATQSKRLAEQEQLLESLRGKLGSAFPTTDRWLTDTDERELSSPWADERWNRARTEVFIQALHLHRTFMECVADKIKENLRAAMDILRGKVSPDVHAETLQSAWATLFFVVPVISTTFASFDRLFSHCGKEAIGWLLVDEAGQAVPQAAAGALWRSKRAIVVGDPRQLEPIVTLPFTAQQALRAYFGVEETWLPSKNSAQMLADRVSRFGTWLRAEGSDEPIWVGSPLRVHRRCEKPMFAISNQIAYNGQMVYGTQESPASLPRSSWIHVGATEFDDHWIPSEGLTLEILLRELFALGVIPSDILLITPFRAVARNLKEIGKRRGISQAGTIHVSQGKESEIVILVLGGDPYRLGAKEWASEKPNLLNVAVSRAKRRLFIIGNREEWSQYQNFSDAAALIERKGSTGPEVFPAIGISRGTSGGARGGT
jgi:hypothetical protein